MAAKTERRIVVPKEQEPNLTLLEAKELLAAAWIESGHYKYVPSDYWTQDIHTLEYAKNRLWLRIFAREHPPKAYEDGAELLTKPEWQVILRAAEMELHRLSVLRKECQTEGHRTLMNAVKKILDPTF